MARLISRTSSRPTTLLIALLTLANNTLSSLLIHQLPDDPFHLAVHYSFYLHFANVLSIFGVIGALRKHPLSILLFSTYLLLDTLLSAIPRLLLLTLLSKSSSIICAPNSTTSLDFSTRSPSSLSPASSPISAYTYSLSSHIPPNTHIPTFSDYMSPMDMDGEQRWTANGCARIVQLGYVTLMVGVVAAMGLQVLGALCVRDYAGDLFLVEREKEIELELEMGLGEGGVEGVGRGDRDGGKGKTWRY
ncbi:hypothetical protein SBOR_3257 [Sclerotinia borealis F-4128]|uniref:Uncharacterized protein n=1 Tax=Sclerotinia borealis (strain F-4128) TaxID=1432307 RepID=W9CKJ8_SCLBF|nr:hypothetical protein SBOR_3257 [Sclerotinia borealis F-4128]